jgi:hypothetical protein
MKFFIPEQPVIRQSNTTTVTTAQSRVFIIVSLKCIASVFRHLDDGLHKSTTLFVLCKRNIAIFEQQFDDRMPHRYFFARIRHESIDAASQSRNCTIDANWTIVDEPAVDVHHRLLVGMHANGKGGFPSVGNNGRGIFGQHR